jgi:hypothetical protein
MATTDYVVRTSIMNPYKVSVLDAELALQVAPQVRVLLVVVLMVTVLPVEEVAGMSTGVEGVAPIP